VLHEAGLYTIRDLANANVYDILKLRGFDIPQVPKDQRLNFPDICDARALAMAVVEKCTVNVETISLYNGEKNMPWNVVPMFGGLPPKTPIIPWHNMKNYDMLASGDDDIGNNLLKWDGCTYNPLIEGLFGPNIDGLGVVSQVPKGTIKDPSSEIENLFCKQTPGKKRNRKRNYIIYVFSCFFLIYYF
jgi:hypothetical protein